MQPLTLFLRGFKGIKSGLGKDEYFLDLSQYDNGEIAIHAPNGRGKSTILQNLHPYTIMPDRVKTYSQSAFSYYDECFLPDSKKELVFKLNDKVYKSVIEINPLKRKTKGFLFVLENDEFRLIDETKDGNIEDYQDTIEKLLGSAKMFFTSIFRAQDAIKIDKYTKGELKDIFAELLCIDELKTYSENAQQISKFLKNKREIYVAEKQKIENILKNEDFTRNAYSDILNKISINNKAIDAYKERNIELEKQLADLKVIENENRNILAKINDLQNRTKERELELQKQKQFMESKRNYYNSRYKELKTELEKEKKILEDEQSVVTQMQEIARVESEYKAITEEISKLDKDIDIFNKELQDIAHTEEKIANLKSQLSKAELERKRSLEKFLTLKTEKIKTSELLDIVPCKGTALISSCKLLQNANEAKNSLQEIEKNVILLQQESAQEVSIKKEIESLVLIANKKNTIQQEIGKILQEKTKLAEKQRAFSVIAEKHKTLIALNEKVQMAKTRIPVIEKDIESVLAEGKKTIDEINSTIQKISNEIESLTKELSTLKIDESVEHRIRLLNTDIESNKKTIAVLESELKELLIKSGQLEQTINSIEEAKNKLVEVNRKIEIIDKEISEWNTVSKIYAEMIPLEIEDAGPEVSEIANQLLNECFGSRFSITIITQEVNKKGEIKDVFEILVYDADTKEKKPLHVLSGGERVWIEEAITKAIGIYNQQKTNCKFTTLFTDERDGALDSENRARYFTLKKKVLELGGFEREYYISHSSTGVEQADAVITL